MFFFVAQIKVGCCTVDILKQLSSEEISRKQADAPAGDRMGRLATHLLKQRRYFLAIILRNNQIHYHSYHS